MMKEKYKSISFVGLSEQYQILKNEINSAISNVLLHGNFINGPEVKDLEQKLAEFSSAKRVVTCASGTDSLLLPLMAWGVGKGDAVFVPSFTFVATAEVVALLNASPVFVDVEEDTFNMSPQSLFEAIEFAKTKGLVPKVVIPVDLFGQPACYDKINALARDNSMYVLADAAQSFGASYKDKKVGSLALVTSTSFFPTKPLGCYGDGGSIFTNDENIEKILRSLRSHGAGQDRYDNIRIGINSRLDTLQAAILIQKLNLLENEILLRQKVADRYNRGLKNEIFKPVIKADRKSAWAQYTIKVKQRDNIIDKLKEAGVPTAVYYPVPLHLQPAYKDFLCSPKGVIISENLAKNVLSLPISSYLPKEQQNFVIESLNKCF